MGFFDLFKKRRDDSEQTEQSPEAIEQQEVAAEEERKELEAGLEKTKTGFFDKLKRAIAGRTTVAYCGFPEGRSFDEEGDGGVLSVTIEDGKAPEIKKIITSTHKYITRHLEITGSASDSEVAAKIIELAKIEGKKRRLFDSWEADDGMYTRDEFIEGHVMFIPGLAGYFATAMGDMEDDYGLLPYPKWDESQQDFCNTMHAYGTSYVCIPTTVADPDMSGAVLEALSYYGKEYITPAYYETTLKGKYFRDEESAEMLDYILFQRTYDLGMIFNWGNMFVNIINISFNPGTDFASTYARDEKAALADIEKFISALDPFE